MQFWDARWIWAHFTKAWFCLSQVVAGTRQICQSKTNWESFFFVLLWWNWYAFHVCMSLLFPFQSIVNSHRFVFFCLPAVGNCGCQGDRQETGQLRGNSATEAHGNGFAAVFRSVDHPSRHCSPAWQLRNVICVPACSVVHTCIWARGATGTALCVCLYSIFLQMFTEYSGCNHFTRDSWESALILILGIYHARLLCIQHTGLCLVEGQNATNSLPGRAHCIITALMPSRAERRQPDQSVSLR